MPTLSPVDTDSLTGKARETIERVQQRSGRIPNMVRLLVNSPAALDGYIAFASALAQGALSPELQALVGVAVTSELGCDYSLAAVSGIARRGGVSDKALDAARTAAADDPRTAALLGFAVDLVREHGRLPEGRVEALKARGFTDGEIAEVIAGVGLNVFRAYFNLTARPVMDFAPAAAA
ncbi:MAG TPA: carboxymuconolactone decarboxylase family protein [Caulobacteraceae bacterium]|jgi:alkylhydroperoxidase family enzyme|nr:carboxymuconolactone decarboxylase family protein [Caulobacteraceae bacterium]